MKKSTEIAITRLAKQLGMTRERFIERAMDRVVPSIDNNLGYGFGAFGVDLIDDYNPTAELNRASEHQLRALADIHPVPQIAIRKRDCQRKRVPLTW